MILRDFRVFIKFYAMVPALTEVGLSKKHDFARFLGVTFFLSEDILYEYFTPKYNFSDLP